MSEEEKKEKKVKNSADKTAQTSSAQNNDDKNKTNNNEIKFEETSEDLSVKSSQKKSGNKIDKQKIERIKKELMADDENWIAKNKNVANTQADSNSNENTLTEDGKPLSRSERIARKNEQLMENVYRYNRQRTKDLAVRRRETLNVVLIVLLFLLLIAVLTLGIYLYLQKITAYDEDYIRVSVSMTNKDIFYETDVSGDLIPKNVSPGDTFKLNIIARNSNAITGDTDGEDWTPIYVRFKITLIIDGVSYDDFIYVEPNSENWERYNKEIEDGYLISEANPTPIVKEDDGYYYCRLILEPNQQVTVIDWLRFSEEHITELVGGNDAVLQVSIEALEAIPNILKNREIWNNAPQHWVLYMTDENNFPNSGEATPGPNNDVNVWWIVLFISLAVVLTISIVFISTRKKKDKVKMADLSRRINRKE